MSEPVPLGARLRIERQDVVIDAPRQHLVDFVLKLLSLKTGASESRECQVCRDTHSIDNLLDCRQGGLSSESV